MAPPPLHAVVPSRRIEGDGPGNVARTREDPIPTCRIVLRFGVRGDLKFISHRDMLRLFRRACARADLPLRHTTGFNPHPRMSLPLPRPVGMESDAECVILEMDHALDPEEVKERLGPRLPEGLTLNQARRLSPSETLQPRRARYRLSVPDITDTLRQRVADLNGLETLDIKRVNHKTRRTRIIAAKPWIDTLEIRDGGVEFTLRVTSQGAVRPAEVASLLGFDPETVNPRIRRMEVQWQ